MNPYQKEGLVAYLQTPRALANLPHCIPLVPSERTRDQFLRLCAYAGLNFDPVEVGEFYLLLQEMGLLRQVKDVPVTYELCLPLTPKVPGAQS